MKANEITKGGKYIAKVSGVLTTVRVDEIREVGRSRMNHYSGRLEYTDKVIYDVTNLKNGRRTTFKSAAKFRRAVVDKPLPEKVQKHLDEVIAGRRPNENLNPELEVMLRQVSPKINAEVIDEDAATEAGYDKLAGGWIG